MHATTCTVTRENRNVVVGLASNESEVREAQRLRWRVFSEEQGAVLDTPEPGFDIDELDAYCQHLVARDAASGWVVGTYRMLTADAARRAGGYYSEREFDMAAIRQPGVRLLELGRSCVMPQYRTGATIALLWSGLAEFVIATGHDALIGCASIPLKADVRAGSHLARALWLTHQAPACLRVTPRLALPTSDREPSRDTAPVPPLLKAYLRSGAVVCGEPCWDPDFDCADLLVYLSLDRIAGRYAKRFLPDSLGHRALPASSPCHTTRV